MDTLLQSQVFFFISSIGFVMLWVLSAILLYYLIRSARAFNEILEEIEESIDDVGDITKEMLEDMRESALFSFLFKKKKKSRKN